MRPVSSDLGWFAAWQESTADMLKMMEAFSKAREYWEVGLWVKASNLGGSGQQSVGFGRRWDLTEATHHVNEILMCCSSTGKRRSSSSSWP